jgi:uncharacterized protein YdhG (YjbR/CyaY superfamily)
MNAKDVDEYLKKLPRSQRTVLEKLRQTIKSVAPDEMTELISYSMPSFKYKGRQFVSYAGYPSHCSFIVMSYAVMDAHKKDLRRYKTDKATIFFSVAKPLSATLVRQLVEARIAEIEKTLNKKER